jgi:hypothetical protein
MVSVALRFLSALLGSLAAFFIAAHALHAGGYISAHTLDRVDEFFRLLIAPLTSLEPGTGKTLLILAMALLAQGLLIALLFHHWDRPQNAAIHVERPAVEIPDRLRSAHEFRETDDLHDEHPCQTPAIPMRLVSEHDDGPSARAIEAAKRLAARHS